MHRAAWQSGSAIQSPLPPQQGPLLPQDINCRTEFFISLKTDALSAPKNR
jgi:hypothetical protein